MHIPPKPAGINIEREIVENLEFAEFSIQRSSYLEVLLQRKLIFDFHLVISKFCISGNGVPFKIKIITEINKIFLFKVKISSPYIEY